MSPAMRRISICLMAGAAAFLPGCASTDPSQAQAERGPNGTIAYRVLIDSNEPGVHIETNQVYAGTTPFELKIFGDKDGTFHCFGDPNYIIRAVPQKPGQHQQSKYFHTGEFFTGDDKIPRRVFFDMAQPEKTFVEEGTPPVWQAPNPDPKS